MVTTAQNNAKTDYNLQVNEKKNLGTIPATRLTGRNCKKDQPFFAVFNLTISHESQIRTRPHIAVHDPAKVKLPPYHPDTPEVRQDWAQYYDQVTKMDEQAGGHSAANLRMIAWSTIQSCSSMEITVVACRDTNDGCTRVDCKCQ